MKHETSIHYHNILNHHLDFEKKKWNEMKSFSGKGGKRNSIHILSKFNFRNTCAKESQIEKPSLWLELKGIWVLLKKIPSSDECMYVSRNSKDNKLLTCLGFRFTYSLYANDSFFSYFFFFVSLWLWLMVMAVDYGKWFKDLREPEYAS